MNLTVIGAIVLAALLVNGGQLDGVYLAVVALAVQAGFEAILPLPAVVYYLQESAAALARINTITVQAPVGTANGETPVPANALQLSADKLSFAYAPHSAPVLTDITFCLSPGKRLAIVGASGAGKSTLAGLLLRFWDCEQGMLRLNDCDISAYSPESVRQIFSVVSQDTYLFNATVGDNILLAKPDADPADFQAVIEAAMLSEFVHKLPQGLATRTGQNGLAISGGERQRIALARALLKNAPVWLLDEPTAGLDAQTEAAVMAHILRAAGSRALILITHRLVGLEDMDEILVLADGKVVERGIAAELLAAQGTFYQMRTLQQDLLNIS